ncbi:lipid II flippase Amj family protein [Paenibacillus filicis]|uniref:Lipid II flippase Amj n=1 Tax=Paenibacillus gyeongsangnamensis TaxID=3388067 RepID=A0ABT4QLF8_9BACL|nr:lipid II flippase Amj family protein [Paenibacillus filicis]MCZ8517698.1 lipid II flippase Amj family protein [Paenibacillus filicis]
MMMLIITCMLTFVIYASETLSYAVRLGGVRARKLAVALSLTGVIVLVSRTSNMVQGITTGHMVDAAISDPSMPLETWFHFIILSASGGTLLSIALFPTAVRLAVRLISKLEAAGSIPRMVATSVTVEQLRQVKHHVRYPRLEMLKRLRAGGIPKRLLLVNAAVTGIYTVGVLCSLFASTLIPEHRMTASMSSGLINGIATILLTVFVDPQVALLMDKAMNEKGHTEDMSKMFGLLMLSRWAGTLLAQVLLLPGAYLIFWLVKVFT